MIRIQSHIVIQTHAYHTTYEFFNAVCESISFIIHQNEGKMYNFYI